MKVIRLTDNNQAKVIKEAIKIIKNLGLVVFPTDTVYGLLIDATNEKAVKKLLKFKNRPAGKAISVFVNDLVMLKDNVKVNNKQEKMLDQILPGHFTVVLSSRHKVSKLLESEKGTLGVRFIKYKPIIDLVKKYGKPLTATSANLASRSPHHSVESLFNELSETKKKMIDLVVDAGKLPPNKPSTVIDLTSEKLKIIRQGDMVFNQSQSFISSSEDETKKIASFILQKLLKVKNADLRSLTFIIEGDLGVGKTIFVKGIGEYLGWDDIISPTFVVYYEYPLLKKFSFKKLYHFDLYQLTDTEEFKYLGINEILNDKNILCIEWGEKAGEIMELLKKKSKIVYVNMKYVDEKKRKIIVNY
ncbi:MAG: threonylcarbamoyl-AMP synthase [Candidatus Roizmanbacteria bacterium]|nr:MAG: threonylcarbamoyl-AMP synthase [Candidatus Roizmanbacteria bacterium]